MVDQNSESKTVGLSADKEVNKKSNTFLGIGLALVLAIAAFFSGFEFGSERSSELLMQAGLFSIFASTPQPADEINLDEFWRVWNLLDNKFVSSSSTDPLSVEERVRGAIDGLVDSYGDPYTIFLPPADAEQFEDDISGNFGGVGMEVGIRDDMVTVISPLPDTPAEQSGVLAGDVIVRIDNKATDGMGIDAAVKLIRGEPGTDVVLTVYREGEIEFKDITVTRAIIKIPTIETEVVEDVFVIKLYNFNALSEMETQKALREYVSGDHKKLILDLRGNPGGFLQSAVAISSFFLPTGKVVVRESFGDNLPEQIYRSQGRVVGDFNTDNFVVLINGGSASASEILAGALKEHDVATVIGERTFGKGSVQELINLPSRASLKVTVARWLTPEGVSFSEGGLEPGVKISRTPQQVIEDADPQLDGALRWLKGERDIADKQIIEDSVGE